MDKIGEYLESRKVLDLFFIEFMKSNKTKETEFKLIDIKGEDYLVSYFFDSSNIIGYDLIKTNEILKTNNINMVAFAVTEGDDIVCINTVDNTIWLWGIESCDGEFIKIEDTFETFISRIIK